MNGRKILFLGEYTGFAGGIECYAFRTAGLLRARGARVFWCGSTPSRDEALFRQGFDGVLTPEQVTEDVFDLAALHKLPSLENLRRWRRLFGERLVFWAHDHDLYCPRRHYYTPFGRNNCHRAFSPLRCALCARISSPRNWRFLRPDPAALLGELREHRAAVLSDFMRENLIRNGFAPERVFKIPPVIDLPALPAAAPAPEGPLKILFLGQLIRGKGADLLLEALRQLRIPWRAKLAGDGADRPLLEARAKAAGLSAQIEFTGWLTDPAGSLQACDTVVFPSRWQEPFGLSGAEGAARAKPVVAFDAGGVREWLTDGVSGFLVPERDTAAMAAKLEMLYRDPALRLRMGAAGRQLAEERFSPECFLHGFQKLFEKERLS